MKQVFQKIGQIIAKFFQALGRGFKQLFQKIKGLFSSKPKQPSSKNALSTDTNAMSTSSIFDNPAERFNENRLDNAAVDLNNYGIYPPAVQPLTVEENRPFPDNPSPETPPFYHPIRQPGRDYAVKHHKTLKNPQIDDYAPSRPVAQTVGQQTVSVTASVNPPATECVPQSLEEFLDLIKRTPRSVLSGRERNLLAAVMSFSTTEVSEIMLPKEAITYVHDDEFLGPLKLDKLYRSGFMHFPVLDRTNEVIGIIHTATLNSLEVKESQRAGEFMDRKPCFVRQDYTLNQALAAFFRTNAYLFIVVDNHGKTVGMLTYQMLTNFLFGKKISDRFSQDSDRMAVAKRKLSEE